MPPTTVVATSTDRPALDLRDVADSAAQALEGASALEIVRWAVDTFGPHNGFWVSIVAGALALLTVLLGRKSLAGLRSPESASIVPQPAE